MKILLTGATGFVGSAVLNKLLDSKFQSVIAIRKNRLLECDCKKVVVETINSETDWIESLQECGVVIHLAARAHIMNDESSNPLSDFRAVNTLGTLNLAEQAAKVGVKRFIFISSIKVNGEQTFAGEPFKPDDSFVPDDPYGLSKYEAEVGLRELSQKTGMEVVIIRPPLIYGPGVKGNFVSMIRWLEKGVPLPLGAINNKRSLVSLDNLVDLIMVCVEHPKAANETFMVSDDNDISTTQLLSKLATGLESPNRLLPVPAFIINACANLLGKKDIAQRLLGSLQVDISKTKSLLGWVPPHTVDDSLKNTAQFYLNSQ